MILSWRVGERSPNASAGGGSKSEESQAGVYKGKKRGLLKDGYGYARGRASGHMSVNADLKRLGL